VYAVPYNSVPTQSPLLFSPSCFLLFNKNLKKGPCAISGSFVRFASLHARFLGTTLAKSPLHWISAMNNKKPNAAVVWKLSPLP
jgi:hypothetical protein